MPVAKSTTVAGYLDGLPSAHRAMAATILDFLKSEFPEFELRLACNMPHLCRGKDYVAGLSAAQAHVSLSPWSAKVLAAHRDKLGGLEATANLIRIPPGWKPDKPLLRSLVRGRLAEIGPPSGPRPQAPRKRAAKPE